MKNPDFQLENVDFITKQAAAAATGEAYPNALSIASQAADWEMLECHDDQPPPAIVALRRAQNALVSFQWKNPDFPFKDADFLLRNPGFLLRNVDFIIKKAGGVSSSGAAGEGEPVLRMWPAVVERACPPCAWQERWPGGPEYKVGDGCCSRN